MRFKSGQPDPWEDADSQCQCNGWFRTKCLAPLPGIVDRLKVELLSAELGPDSEIMGAYVRHSFTDLGGLRCDHLSHDLGGFHNDR